MFLVLETRAVALVYLKPLAESGKRRMLAGTAGFVSEQ